MTTTRSPQIDLGERTVGEVMRLGVVTARRTHRCRRSRG